MANLRGGSIAGGYPVVTRHEVPMSFRVDGGKLQYSLNGTTWADAEFTGDATAVAGNIFTGKTAYIGGTKITGSMPNRGAISGSVGVGGTYSSTQNGYVTTISVTGPTLSGDAAVANVLDGKTFYNTTGTKQTGTMTNRGTVNYTPGTSDQTIGGGYHSGTGKVYSLGGNAAAGDVLTGHTFSSNTAGRAIAGTMPNKGPISGSVAVGGTYSSTQNGYVTTISVTGPTLSGDAVIANVLNGKTFYSNSGSKLTGNMSNYSGSTLSPQSGGSIVSTVDDPSYPGLHGLITAPSVATGYVSTTTNVVQRVLNLNAGNIKAGAVIGGNGTAGMTGTFTSDATAVAGNILLNKTAYVNGSKVTGSMPNNGATGTTLTTGGSSYSIPAGYTTGGTVTATITNLSAGNIKDGTTVGGVLGTYTEQATNAISASTVLSGKIGYVNGAQITGNIASKGAQTYTPGTSDQTIATGQYLSGVQTIKGDANLVSGNIKSGVTIFGVSGNSNVVDTSAGDATAAQILSGKKAYVDGSLVTGNMTNRGAVTDSITTQGGSYTIPAGYHNGSGSVTASIADFQVDFSNYTPSNTANLFKPDGAIVRSNASAFYTKADGSAGASVGDYALFAGGDDGGLLYYVAAYNSSLVRSYTPSDLSVGAYHMGGASNENYAIFAGGITYAAGGTRTGTVYAYDASLVRSIPTALSVARSDMGLASVGAYAVFAGGSYYSGYSANVDAYNASLVRSSPTALPAVRESAAGASVGNYALFAGGNNYGAVNTVTAYNTSLTRTAPTALSVGRYGLAGASHNNMYALFGGGYGSNRVTTVDAYNTSLTRTTPTVLSLARENPGAASTGVYSLFAGGMTNSGTTNRVDIYDASLTRSTGTNLAVARRRMGCATVNGYALFAAGENTNNVDAYRPESSAFTQHVPIGTKYNFGGGEQTASSKELTIFTPATGYIKYIQGVV